MAASTLSSTSAQSQTPTPNLQQSPRNAANQSMVAVKFNALEVSKTLQEGEKCVKWDEVSWLWDFWLILRVVIKAKA